MERITNIQNIIENEEITKTIMTISDGRTEKEAEVYLAFLNVETGKRYIVYTTDLNKSENEKATFNLATMPLKNGEYVLEAASREEHQNVELKVLNIIGLNGNKSQEEVEKMLKNEFPNISMIDLEALKRNINQMSISVENPPKKANMPIVIAGMIKRYYLLTLNKELKKIYKNDHMTQEEIEESSNKLDKIDNKLDELHDIYYQYPDNDKYNEAVEYSLNEIEEAKENILEAKRSLDVKKMSLEHPELEINDLEEQGIDLTPELPKYDEYQTTQDDNQTLNEDTKEDKKIESEQPKIEQPSLTSINESTNSETDIDEIEKFAQSYISLSKEEIDSKKQVIVDESVDKFGYSVESIVEGLTSGISIIYEEQLQIKEQENQNLKSQIEFSENEKGELLVMVENVKNKALEAAQQAKTSKEQINNLTTKNNELEKENIELKSTVDSQKQLLDQQNSNMEALREEGKSRETNLLQELEALKQENSRLKSYENAYNQIVGMVNSQTNAEKSSISK